MAIQVDMSDSRYGTPFTAAYFRIINVNIHRLSREDVKFGASIGVAGYATSTPNGSTHDIDFRNYNVNLDEINVAPGESFLDKCYSWVMTQPDMDNSIAV